MTMALDNASRAGDPITLRDLNRAGRREYLALFFCEHLLGAKLFGRLFAGAKERNRERLLAAFVNRPDGGMRPVREVPFATFAELDRSDVPKWEPVVFRGAARRWPAVATWDIGFFASKYANTQAIKIDQHGLYGEDEGDRYTVTTLGSIASAIQAGERQCLRFSPIIDENPELKDDLDMKWLAGFRSAFSVRGLPQFFMAPAATHTPLHCALESNAFVQIYGKKRWVLYPSWYQPLLEPPAARRPYFFSGVHPDRVNPELPLARYAPAYEVILEPGDVLYFPPFVWHYVENITDTIAVAYRYFSLRTAFRTAAAMTMLRFLATNPSLVETLYYSLTKTTFLYKPQKA